jgi:Cd2+/Zn2+-exporting ATPase
MPEDKVAAVKELTRRAGGVAMAGDGVNDAPAMAAADFGIAMGAIGSDVAIETADITLMSDEIARIPWLVRHSRRALAIIKQNVALALGIKVVFVALAVFGLATLWMAIAADMGVSLLVIFNGLRLLDRGEMEEAPPVAAGEAGLVRG